MVHGIRVGYRVAQPGRPDRKGFVRCAFAGGRLDDDRLKIVGIEIDGSPLSDARLYMLARFWLADPDAPRDGEKRLGGITNRPIVEVALPARVAYWVQQVVNALPVSAFYAFLAVAYALVYGLVNRINLAFGEIAIVGAYAAVSIILMFGSALVGGAAGGVVAAILTALTVAALHGTLLGATVGEYVYRPLARAGHRSFLIATIGLGIFLIEAMRLLSGSRDRWIQPILNDPIVLFGGPFEVTLTSMKAVEIGGAAAILAVVMISMRRSGFGRSWRAVADDALMARLLGIDATRVAVLTFAASSALAALAGGFAALHYGQATYGASMIVGLKALGAALLGGIGSLGGAALGGLVIGLVETMWSAGMPVEWRDVALLSVVVIVLVLKPEGLFGFGRPPENAADSRWAQRDD